LATKLEASLLAAAAGVVATLLASCLAPITLAERAPVTIATANPPAILPDASRGIQNGGGRLHPHTLDANFKVSDPALAGLVTGRHDEAPGQSVRTRLPTKASLMYLAVRTFPPRNGVARCLLIAETIDATDSLLTLVMPAPPRQYCSDRLGRTSFGVFKLPHRRCSIRGHQPQR
jgi:hypothetical protein